MRLLADANPKLLSILSICLVAIGLFTLKQAEIITGDLYIIVPRKTGNDQRRDLSFQKSQTLTMEEKHAAVRFAELADSEIASLLNDIKMEEDPSSDPKNIFFLKTSKTGSTTLMSIFQRYGLKYNQSFLLGENNGGMARNDRPLNLEDDCWIGKNSKKKKRFNISTNHLHYNKTAVNALMSSNHFKLAILRQPDAQFVSSFKYYHDLFPKLAIELNPHARYNMLRRRTLDLRYKPSEDDIIFEINNFLENPWGRLSSYDRATYGWMGLIRPQLLFFGQSPNGIDSFDRAALSRDETIRWIKEIIHDFDLLLILEHLELSLALISIQLNIPTSDLVYHAVNCQAQKLDNNILSEETLVNLKRLNWPDFMLYQAANATLWAKVKYFGEERVKAVAAQIEAESKQLSRECIDSIEFGPPTSKIDPVILRPEKQRNATCRRMIFQGTPTTKLFQAKEIDQLLQEEPDYKFCTSQIIYGMDNNEFNRKKKMLLRKYSTMQGN